jgi:hypothetical protein
MIISDANSPKINKSKYKIMGEEGVEILLKTTQNTSLIN